MITLPFISSLRASVRISKRKCCCNVQTMSPWLPFWQNVRRLLIAMLRHLVTEGPHQEGHCRRMLQCQWTWVICRGISLGQSPVTTVRNKATLPVIAHYARHSSLHSSQGSHCSTLLVQLLQPSHGVSMNWNCHHHHHYHMERKIARGNSRKTEMGALEVISTKEIDEY